MASIQSPSEATFYRNRFDASLQLIVDGNCCRWECKLLGRGYDVIHVSHFQWFVDPRGAYQRFPYQLNQKRYPTSTVIDDVLVLLGSVADENVYVGRKALQRLICRPFDIST